jgi:MmyB-like transcription regulator ligand binding domain
LVEHTTENRGVAGSIPALATSRDAFRTWWAAHNVRYHQTGTKRLHHPVVGDLELGYEVMELAADAGLRLAVFTAEPGSRSQEALDMLASWAATPESANR